MIICKDQKEVNALDEFFEDGDVVEYESCSLFIDTVYTKCNDYCDGEFSVGSVEHGECYTSCSSAFCFGCIA